MVGCGGVSAVARAAVDLGERFSIEIASRADILGGKSFGNVGAYEKIVGKVYFSIDPTHPRNVAGGSWTAACRGRSA